MKILIPTDLSEQTNCRLLDLMSLFESQVEIILYHALEPAVTGSTMMNINDLVLKRRQNKLEELVDRLKENTNISASFVLEQGFLLVSLKAFLELNSVNLFISLSKKRIGMKRLFNRQQSLRFVQELSVPLLVIPLNYKLKSLQSIGLAVHQREAISVLESDKFSELSAYFKMELKPFHVDNFSEKSLDVYISNESKVIKDKSIEMVFDVNVEEGIDKWCKQMSIDALCMITSEKNVFEKTFSHSVIKTLVKTGNFPILVLTNSKA